MLKDLQRAQLSILPLIHRSIEHHGSTTDELALKAGISPAYLQSYLSGNRSLAPSRLVALCKELEIDFAVVSQVLDQAVGGTSCLRVSHAARSYDYSYCGILIRQAHEYVRLESFRSTRQSSAPVRYFCRACAIRAHWLVPREKPLRSFADVDGTQLNLPFASHLKPTIVQLVDISDALSRGVFTDLREMSNLAPTQFEEFVLDRLIAMGLRAQLVGGGTNRRDGGIDIIFTPPKGFVVPFVGAVQVKHRRNPNSKIGPEPLRELMGVLASKRVFAAGMVVTNTFFTADAIDFADHNPTILRLRNFDDLKRWVAGNFTDDAEWKEIPERIEVCKGVFVDLV